MSDFLFINTVFLKWWPTDLKYPFVGQSGEDTVEWMFYIPTKEPYPQDEGSVLIWEQVLDGEDKITVTSTDYHTRNKTVLSSFIATDKGIDAVMKEIAIFIRNGEWSDNWPLE